MGKTGLGRRISGLASPREWEEEKTPR